MDKDIDNWIDEDFGPETKPGENKQEKMKNLMYPKGKDAPKGFPDPELVDF